MRFIIIIYLEMVNLFCNFLIVTILSHIPINKIPSIYNEINKDNIIKTTTVSYIVGLFTFHLCL